jgi:glycosyltransferase involved in cell wall biosynthesis
MVSLNDLADNIKLDIILLRIMRFLMFLVAFCVHFFNRINLAWPVICQKPLELVYRLFGKGYQWERSIMVSRFYGRCLKHRLANKDWDFILADKGSIVIAHLETNIPILYCSDITYFLINNYYSSYFNLSQKAVKEGNLLEKMALDRAFMCLFRSQWAADSAIKDYNISPDKVFVTSFGPNINEEYVPEHSDAIKMPRDNECNLLLVGREWYRKGCDTAIEAVNILRNSSINANLTICGAEGAQRCKCSGICKYTTFSWQK